jgi:DNA-binding MarR family transcriptional regulator
VSTGALDPKIHAPKRLAICAVLAAAGDWVEFSAVRDAVAVSDSTLSKQSLVLEDAGFLEVRKGAVGRRPRTWFRLTPAGRHAFADHLSALQDLAATAVKKMPSDHGAVRASRSRRDGSDPKKMKVP